MSAMLSPRIIPSFDTFQQFASLLTDCIKTRNLISGKCLHSYFIKSGLTLDTFISNRLIHMYSKCKSIESAQRAFDDLSYKNTYSWNTIISGCCQNFRFNLACKLLDQMPETNIVSYNAIISGLSRSGLHKESIKFFKCMQNEYGVVFVDECTVISIVGVCACLGALEFLRQLHGMVVVIGFESATIIYNALVNAYGKCGLPHSSYMVFCQIVEKDDVSWNSILVAYAQASMLQDAFRIFDQMPLRNTVSWTSLIVGLLQNGCSDEALDLFKQMLAEAVQANTFTFVAVLGACADLAVIEKGKQLHSQLIRCGAREGLWNIYIYNALIDMYCKCGDMKSAGLLFESMADKDIVSWNSMVTGFAQNGHTEESLDMFKKMRETGVKPNSVTFLGVLHACAHAGLVCEGLNFIALMTDYGLKPEMEHHSVLIDLLGRKNRLEEAVNLIESSPNGSVNVRMWSSLLGACHVHSNMALATKAAEALSMLEPNNAGRYVKLSNIFTSANRWDDAREVRKRMYERGLQKEVAFSSIEVQNTRYEFAAKDESHCMTKEIYEVVHSLVDHMSAASYFAHFDSFVTVENA